MIDGDFDTVKSVLMDKLKSAENPMDLQSIVMHWVDMLDDDDWELKDMFKRDLTPMIDKRFKGVKDFDGMREALMKMHNEYVVAVLVAMGELLDE